MKVTLNKSENGMLIDPNTNKTYSDVDDFINKNHIGKKPMLITMSLIMYGVHKCSGSCVYCSAAAPQGYNDNGLCNNFKLDKDAVDNKIIDFCKKSRGIDITKNSYHILQIDLWGANPLSNMKEFKQTVDYCKSLEGKYFKKVLLSTSGNGLEFASKKVLDYMVENNISYQLSHDGLGQWQRTGDIDPLYDKRTKDNIVALTKAGLLRNINCTLSERNPSFYANYEYWEKWIKENDLERPNIKLNKVAPGTKPVNKPWWGKDNPQIKHGEIIGAQTINKNCDIYFQEWEKMYYDPSVPNTYKSYFNVQLNSYKHQGENRINSQSCYKYQKGYQDWNFAIDTMGYYCACNLVDHDNHCNGEGSEQPEECKSCKYNDTTECNPCETEQFEQVCTFRKRQCELLEKIKRNNNRIEYYEIFDRDTGKTIKRAKTLKDLGFTNKT